MTPRQPARRGKVPNPTNESKDEEEQKVRYSVGSTEYFLFFPEMRKEERIMAKRLFTSESVTEGASRQDLRPDLRRGARRNP